MRLIAFLILALAPVLSPAALAQEPPGRAGRVAFTEGTVALYQDPDMGWEKAYVNSPITSENSLWTDPASRAEVRVSGIAVRLDEETQLDVARLDDERIDGFVVRGSVAVRVRHFENDNTLDFATPNAQFRLYGAGRYRIDVDPDRDETVLTVFTGSAGMRSGQGDIQVRAGSAIRVMGGDAPSFVREAARTSSFDRWTLARDDRWIERRSTQYVSTWMTGYEDLDAYGEWVQEPEFGAVWFPTRVDRGWIPYRDGHWAWVRPWGWTWVGAEPWGYAPYHYGRWTYVRNRWGWVPGPRERQPVWAPALVAWVGGSNFSVRVDSGPVSAVGWYPLSPWDRYEPWYRTNATYVNRVNVIVREAPARRDLDEWRYRNRERGATVVRRDQFVDRRPVRQAAINVAPEVIRQAPIASPTTMFTREDVLRRSAETRPQLRTPGSPPASGAPVTGGAPATRQAPASAPAPAPGQPVQRRPEAGTNFRPNFERRITAPAPQPSTQPAQAAPAPGANPLVRPRGDERGRPPQAQPQPQQQQQQQQQQQRDLQQQQERAAREAQQQQQRSTREAEQQGERAAREARQQQQRALQEQQRQQQEQQRQQQERGAREAQQQQQRAGQEQQRQQQEQQRQQQERGAREAQQQQQRAAQEQQRQQQEQQRQQQEQQRQQQERGAREAQQQQQRAAQEQQRQQQEQQRAAQEQQRQQQAQQRQAEEQQRQQARAAREAQLKAAQEAQQRAQQQRAQPPAPPPQAAPQAQPPQAPPQPPPQSQRPDRGRDDKGKDKDKGKGNDDPDPERERGGGRNR